MIKERLIPQIRFKGFADEWVQKQLNELGEFKSNGVDKKTNRNEYFVNLLNYMDVYNKISVNRETCSKLMQVTAKKNQIIENNVLKNDIFITPSSETKDDIGRVMVVEDDLPNTVYSYHIVRYRPYSNSFYSVFPNYVLDTFNVRNQMMISAQGVQRFVIGKTAFENIKINTPSILEQQKIGLYFKNIDKLISLEQEKYDKLLMVKKSLLDKMFPKGDEVTPKIRFRGFCDDWKTYKLGQLVIDTIDNRGKNPTYYCETGIPIIDNFMIKNNGYPDLSIATRYLDNYLFENFIRKYNEVDDVLITLVGNGIGNIALFPKTKSVIVQNTIGLRFEENKKFKYYSLLSKNSAIVKLDRGMAQPSIRQDELKDIDIEVTNLEEQEKISTFLEKLDRIIIVRKQKIEKLKNVKSALLNKMFV